MKYVLYSALVQTWVSRVLLVSFLVLAFEGSLAICQLSAQAVVSPYSNITAVLVITNTVAAPNADPRSLTTSVTPLVTSLASIVEPTNKLPEKVSDANVKLKKAMPVEVVGVSNIVPALLPLTDQAIKLGAEVAVVAILSNSVPSTNGFKFSLLSAPSGMTINSTNGLIQWKPQTNPAPSTNVILILVSDSLTPQLSDSKSFTIKVEIPNTPPRITQTSELQACVDTLFEYLVPAFDNETPSNKLKFALQSPPNGMTIDPTNGIIRWRPTENDTFTTNSVSVTVTDDGTPPLSEFKEFQLVVTNHTIFNLTSRMGCIGSNSNNAIPVELECINGSNVDDSKYGDEIKFIRKLVRDMMYFFNDTNNWLHKVDLCIDPKMTNCTSEFPGGRQPGRITLGLPLLSALYNAPISTAYGKETIIDFTSSRDCILGAIAHEFGHQIQAALLQTKYQNDYTPGAFKRTRGDIALLCELEADSLAGAFLKAYYSIDFKNAKSIMEVFRQIDTCDFNKDDFHGGFTDRWRAFHEIGMSNLNVRSDWGKVVFEKIHKITFAPGQGRFHPVFSVLQQLRSKDELTSAITTLVAEAKSGGNRLQYSIVVESCFSKMLASSSVDPSIPNTFILADNSYTIDNNEERVARWLRTFPRVQAAWRYSMNCTDEQEAKTAKDFVLKTLTSEQQLLADYKIYQSPSELQAAFRNTIMEYVNRRVIAGAYDWAIDFREESPLEDRFLKAKGTVLADGSAYGIEETFTEGELPQQFELVWNQTHGAIQTPLGWTAERDIQTPVGELLGSARRKTTRYPAELVSELASGTKDFRRFGDNFEGGISKNQLEKVLGRKIATPGDFSNREDIGKLRFITSNGIISQCELLVAPQGSRPSLTDIGYVGANERVLIRFAEPGPNGIKFPVSAQGVFKE